MLRGQVKPLQWPSMIQNLGKKLSVLAHNKTLAAQLYAEFRNFFQKMPSAYYDYYQPEAYVPGTDTYIEKDSSVNDEIDRFVTPATRSF